MVIQLRSASSTGQRDFKNNGCRHCPTPSPLELFPNISMLLVQLEGTDLLPDYLIHGQVTWDSAKGPRIQAVKVGFFPSVLITV